MAKRLLIFAWEYNGYHSVQGAALARRTRQVAESFKAHNWDVTVIHKDQRNESEDGSFKVNYEENGIRRICVKSEAIEDFDKKSSLQRKLETFYYVAFRGDRSYKWAAAVIRNFDRLGVDKNIDLIISFYTPRAPMYLGSVFAQKLKAPWIADIQDPILAGVSSTMKKYSRAWTKRILKPAKAVVHISPEWAEIDGQETGRKIDTIRHAVPEPVVFRETGTRPSLMAEYKDSFNVFYGGSLSPNIQSLELLKKVVKSVAADDINVKILVAGNEKVYNLFKDELGGEVVKPLGWLTHDVMYECVAACNCTLVIPWSKVRIGIPSKFYELCSFPKPIWIIGDDIGGFTSLLKEWNYTGLQINNFDFQRKALLAAVEGDYSGMFNVESCKGRILRPNDLFDEYMKLYEAELL